MTLAENVQSESNKSPAAKHTPGPWRVQKWNYRPDLDGKKWACIYAIVGGKREGPFENEGDFHPEDAQYFTDEFQVVTAVTQEDLAGIKHEADARLISSAPELLVAVEALCCWAKTIDVSEHNWVERRYHSERIAAAEAALAKATGGAL